MNSVPHQAESMLFSSHPQAPFEAHRPSIAASLFKVCMVVVVSVQLLFAIDVSAQADATNGASYFEMGERYRFGDDGYQVDMDAAFRAFQNAVQTGDVRAHYYLGAHYFLGQGVKKSYRSAVGHYLQALKHGSEEAACCYLIASCYDYLGERANYMRYIQRAIDLNYPAAFHLVGSSLAEEHHNSLSTSAHLWNLSAKKPKVNKMKGAYHFWTKGAELGDASCKIRLAQLHIDGLFVTQDDRKAEQFLKEAWLSGEGDAAVVLSYLYSESRRPLFSPEKAFYYAAKAAEAGVAEGYFLLATCYEKGLGVNTSHQMRKQNLQIAAEMGNQSAINALQQLRAPQNSPGYVSCYACGGQGDVRWNDGDTTGCRKCSGTGSISREDADLYRDSGQQTLDGISRFLGIN